MTIKKRPGFTLIELIVTMAIIGLLTGLLVTNVSHSLSNNRLADDVALLNSKVEHTRLLAGSTQQSATTPGLQTDPDSAYYALYFPAASNTSYDVVKVSSDLNSGQCAINVLTNANCLVQQVTLGNGVTLLPHPDQYLAFKAPVQQLTGFSSTTGTWQPTTPSFTAPFLKLTFNARSATVTVDPITGKISATYQ